MRFPGDGAGPPAGNDKLAYCKDVTFFPTAMATSAPTDSSDHAVGFLFHDVARALRKRFDRKAARLGLTRAQWSVLFHLNRCEGVNQRTLATTLEVEPITLTRILDRMEQRGWIERRPDPHDRRAHRLHLTVRARPVLEELLALAAENRAEALRGIGEDDRAQFARTLAAVKANLTALFAADAGAPETTLSDENQN